MKYFSESIMDTENKLFNKISKFIKKILLDGILPQMKILGNYAYIINPIFKINQVRVDAEICMTLLNLMERALIVKEKYSTIIEKICNWLIKKQNKDGSWNETHLLYNKPSVVFTSITGLALIKAYKNLNLKYLEESIIMAKEFLLKQEINRSGKFRKSMDYHIDTLNADSMATVFFVYFNKLFSDKESIDVVKRTIKNIITNQFTDGAYPYTDEQVAYPFNYHLNIPCIHYQSVTLYYLLQTYSIFNDNMLKQSIKKGISWFLNSHNDNGSFNWKKSSLNFALYLTATHSFAIANYILSKKHNIIDEYPFEKINNSLDKLKYNTYSNIFLRWERAPWCTLIKDIRYVSIKGAFVKSYPLKYNVQRKIHRIYREVARRRICKKININNNKNRLIGLFLRDRKKLSTMDPLCNYPDTYMTSEIIDSLSLALSYLK